MLVELTLDDARCLCLFTLSLAMLSGVCLVSKSEVIQLEESESYV
jgi:hypothetical protein